MVPIIRPLNINVHPICAATKEETAGELRNEDLVTTYFLPALYSGDVVAVLIDLPIAARMLMLDQHCSLYLMDKKLAYLDYHFALSGQVTSEEVTLINLMVYTLLQTDAARVIINQWISFVNPACGGSRLVRDSVFATGSLGFRHLAGLWVVLGVAGALALLLLIINELARYQASSTFHSQHRR
jgi:hypothetical protein